jgi:hypothetical protein
MPAKPAAILSASILLIAGTAYAGWEFTAVTKADGKGAETMNTTVRAWIDGDRARVEFMESGNPMTPKGAYLTTTDGGATARLVNPAAKTYAKWDMDAMASMAGSMMKMVNMTFSTPKVEKLLEEKGEKIAGQPTTHARYRTSYSMDVTMMGFKQSTEHVKEEELWMTDALKDKAATLWTQQREVKTGNEELDALIKAQQKTVEGFPLKTVAVTRQTRQGATEVTTVTMEVKELKPAEPDDDLFAVPPDYAETSLLGSMGGGAGRRGAVGQGEAPASSGNPVLDALRKRRQQQP